MTMARIPGSRNLLESTVNSVSIRAVMITILIPLFLVSLFVIICCCTTKRSCMKYGVNLLRYWYDSCCFRFDCVASLNLRTAINRYWENPPPSKEELLNNTTNNPFIGKILLHVAKNLPEFFFSFLPTGSLREGCGKLLPSTAVLATDYDLLIVPDGITAGGRCNPSATEQITPPTFLTTENELIPTGFVWLSLSYLALEQWTALTIPRYVEGIVEHYLSVAKMKELLSKKIRDIAYADLHLGTVSSEVTHNGPAITVKINKEYTKTEFIKNLCCPCCNVKEDNLTLFHCDFTIGIHHPTWPMKAKNWFSPERRRNWPSSEIVERIKDRGCHLVPKPSTKGVLLKFNPAQSALTSYDQAPSLEWRYSFSQPELELFDRMPEVAKQAFVALKAINKAHLTSKSEHVKNLGYELKTITMRFVEQQHPQYWQENESDDVFRRLLEVLHDALKTGRCLHYWIDENNLLEDFPVQRLSELAQIVEKIQKNPCRYVADNWLEYTRCLRFHCPYFGPRSIKQQFAIAQFPMIATRRDPCCMIPCSYAGNTTASCWPCPYDDINFEVY